MSISFPGPGSTLDVKIINIKGEHLGWRASCKLCGCIGYVTIDYICKDQNHCNNRRNECSDLFKQFKNYVWKFINGI